MTANPISARLHYATIAMLELAMQYESGGLICVRDIAQQHHIPLPFLTQILNQMRSHGLVVSVRGASGGYKLSRSPDSITMADIAAVWAINSELQSSSDTSEVAQLSNSVWLDAQSHMQSYLGSIHLDYLVEQMAKDAHMFHI